MTTASRNQMTQEAFLKQMGESQKAEQDMQMKMIEMQAKTERDCLESEERWTESSDSTWRMREERGKGNLRMSEGNTRKSASKNQKKLKMRGKEQTKRFKLSCSNT